MLVYLGMASLAAAFLLALHHWYIHKDNPPEDGKGNPCLLQPSDVCVFTRGTHETPIILLMLLAAVLILAGSPSVT